MIAKIRLEDKIEQIEGLSWQPVAVTEVNEQVVRLAYFFGSYHWHRHDNADELFYVLKGKITIKLPQEEITLQAGEMAVVPKETAHCPVSEKGALVLLFEPREIKSEKLKA